MYLLKTQGTTNNKFYHERETLKVNIYPDQTEQFFPAHTFMADKLFAQDIPSAINSRTICRVSNVPTQWKTVQACLRKTSFHWPLKD